MRDLAAGAHWTLAGAGGESGAGNGAAMRIAPLAFLLDPEDAGQRALIREVCRITHHHEEAYVGALAVVLAIRSVLQGTWSPETSFLAAALHSLPQSAVRGRMERLLPLDLPPVEVGRRFGCTGYVVDTVPLALYCAQGIAREDLPPVLARTIAAGGDTDTIASITGQIGGTVVGSRGIPPDLFAAVEGGDEVAGVARKFAGFAAARQVP